MSDDVEKLIAEARAQAAAMLGPASRSLYTRLADALDALLAERDHTARINDRLACELFATERSRQSAMAERDALEAAYGVADWEYQIVDDRGRWQSDVPGDDPAWFVPSDWPDGYQLVRRRKAGPWVHVESALAEEEA